MVYWRKSISNWSQASANISGVPLHGNRGLRIEHSDVQAWLKLKCTHPGASTEDDCRGILLEMCNTNLSSYIQELGPNVELDEKTKCSWRVAEYLHFDPEIKRLLAKEVLSSYKECHNAPNNLLYTETLNLKTFWWTTLNFTPVWIDSKALRFCCKRI